MRYIDVAMFASYSCTVNVQLYRDPQLSRQITRSGLRTAPDRAAEARTTRACRIVIAETYRYCVRMYEYDSGHVNVRLTNH